MRKGHAQTHVPAGVDIRLAIAAVIALFLSGFLLSSGIIDPLLSRLGGSVGMVFQNLIDHHRSTLYTYPAARHYFLLPEGMYVRWFIHGLSPEMVPAIISNAFFNGLFQPLFLCVFTPEVVARYALFPFFIVGVVKYFKKVPIMMIFFFAFLFYVALYNSIVEPLVRHRMPCDLIYLSIGLAGFVDVITKRSS